ncbi:hypothetical protein RCS94_00570 [Orbaceae bacterium ac157xtp]
MNTAIKMTDDSWITQRIEKAVEYAKTHSDDFSNDEAKRRSQARQAKCLDIINQQKQQN